MLLKNGVILSSKSVFFNLKVWCDELMCLATNSAYSVSSKKGSSAKPMLKVWMLSWCCFANAEIMDESKPPLKKHPTGTSACRRNLTASLNNSLIEFSNYYNQYYSSKGTRTRDGLEW